MILEPWSKRLAGSTLATAGLTVVAGARAFVAAAAAVAVAAACFAAMAACFVLRPRPRLRIPLLRGLEDMISKNSKLSGRGGCRLLPSRDWSRADMMRQVGRVDGWMSGREADTATWLGAVGGKKGRPASGAMGGALKERKISTGRAR